MGMLQAIALAATDRWQEGQLIALLEWLLRTLELLIDGNPRAVGNGISEAQGLPHAHSIGAALERPWLFSPASPFAQTGKQSHGDAA